MPRPSSLLPKGIRLDKHHYQEALLSFAKAGRAQAERGCFSADSAAKRSAGGACPVPQGRAGATGGLPAPSSSTDRRMTCDSAWISDNSAASQTEPLSACWKRNAPRDQAGEVAYCSSLQELKHTRPTAAFTSGLLQIATSHSKTPNG